MFISLLDESETCILSEQLECSNRILDVKKFSLFEKCDAVCPLECNQTHYRYSMSSLAYSDANYVGSIKKNRIDAFRNRSKIDLSKSQMDRIVDISLFYDSLSFKRSIQTANLDVVLFFGNFGSDLGLFLGISMLSICEVFGLLMDIYVLNRKINKHNTN
jgi:hypothetical protein